MGGMHCGCDDDGRQDPWNFYIMHVGYAKVYELSWGQVFLRGIGARRPSHASIDPFQSLDDCIIIDPFQSLDECIIIDAFQSLDECIIIDPTHCRRQLPGVHGAVAGHLGRDV